MQQSKKKLQTMQIKELEMQIDYSFSSFSEMMSSFENDL